MEFEASGEAYNSVRKTNGALLAPRFCWDLCGAEFSVQKILKNRSSRNRIPEIDLVTVNRNLNFVRKHCFKSPRFILIVQHHDWNHAQRLAARAALRNFAL